MCCNRELTERVLELLEMVTTNDQMGRGPFDMQIKNNYNLATLSSEFSNNMTIDKL